jgi:hypothetical protein
MPVVDQANQEIRAMTGADKIEKAKERIEKRIQNG